MQRTKVGEQFIGSRDVERKDSGLSARAFGVYWNLKDDEPLRNAGISAMELARDAETEMRRFPNARVNDDERRKLRATLYRPLLGLGKEDRSRVVDLVLATLRDRFQASWHQNRCSAPPA